MTNVDRRFGSWNRFGSTNTFGASMLEASLAWSLRVDWDGDGVFDSRSEARYMCGLRTNRGRTAMLRSTGQGFEPMRTGQAVISLWNTDGRYDGWNASSPLYPNVTPGKDVELRVRDLSATGTVIEYVFSGTISDIVPNGYGAEAKVNLYIDDGWNFLRNYSARVAMQENINVSTAIGYVLDAVGWLSRWGRDLDASSDNIRYFWGSGDKSAAVECEDLANSAFGNFFITKAGAARFVSRTNVGTSVADYDQSELYKDIENPQPWVYSRNVTQLRAHVRDATGTALLFEQFGEAVQIADGETYRDFVSLTFNGLSVPALSIVAPVANVDYSINSNSAGSGSDVSGSCTVSVTRLGDRAKRSITNNSGAAAYVTMFKIRGVAVYERNVTDVNFPSDPDTVKTPRRFFMDLLWLQNVNAAFDFANLFGPFLSAAHPFPVIEIESNFSKQFEVELFDVVTLTSSKLGINGVSFRVGGIEHESLDENCQRIKTRLYLEPYVAGGDYGTFPLTWGESTFGW